MRVLQINSVCGIGSTGRIATDIHSILNKHGHDSYIAYGRGVSKNCNKVIRIGTNYDNYAHVALTRVSDKHGFGSVRATRDFIRKMEEIDPDIIHLHNIHGYYINIQLLFDYLKKADKPVIWTLHDCWAFTGHCAYFDYAGCDKWKTQCGKCPEKKSYPASKLVDNSKENYSKKKTVFSGVKNMTIVTPSRWLAGLVKQSFLQEYSVEVINNGIDLEVFKPTTNDIRERYKLGNKFIILGVAGVWDRRKGLNYFKELSEKLGKDEAIVLVGLTEKQKEGLSDNVIAIPRTSNVKELVDFYSTADVFVNPTLEDNFPTTNLEALACSTPVITFETGGSTESIDCNTGVVVEQGSVSGLLHAIKGIKDNVVNNYTTQCRELALRSYNKEDRYNDYLELYLKISR